MTAGARILGGWTAVALAVLTAVEGAATEVKIYKGESRSALLAGTLEGVSVDPLGRLRLADRVERLTAVEEPFLLAGAVHPQGWVVGTGNAGRVLLVDRDGRVTELFAAPEPEVFALWVDPDGTVFAGTSPQGKVYRIPAGGGAAEEFFDPGEIYVWALARAPGGALLVATGTQGKLFRVDGRGRGEVVYDSEDTHLRSLAVTPDGEILVGTAGEGLILAVDPAKGPGDAARTLYDATAAEVAALALGPDGTAYAALVASEASLVDLARDERRDEPGDGESDEAEGAPRDSEVTIRVSAGAGTSGSRRSGFSGPRSELVRIDRDGLVETVTELEKETVFTLAWARGRLWVGSGLEGKLYSWTAGDSELVLEKDVDERQVVALLGGDGTLAFATTNAAALYRVATGTERRGLYTSSAVDAGQVARFGSFRWRGEEPGPAAVRFSFRSGMSAEPDRTWSSWTPWVSGRQLPLEDLPRGRYLQWRAELAAPRGTSPVLAAVEISYLQANLPPKIDRLQVLDPGQILVAANFNPTNQVFEPFSPTREGIFTTLRSGRDDGDSRLKTLWKKGYRTVRWRADDPNGDPLSYTLEFAPEGASGDPVWLPVIEDLEEDYYSFDATVLPDGVYRFRLTADDSRANASGEAKRTERFTEPVVIDHSPPRLAGVSSGSGGRRTVRIEDDGSPLAQVALSVDAGPWKDLVPEDGLLDGHGESFALDVPEGATLVILRVLDGSHNTATFDLSRPRS